MMKKTNLQFFYLLDEIIVVGYRINSYQASQFRNSWRIKIVELYELYYLNIL